ncbi:UNVERIFIED_CONTAM: hypothetical protein ABIE34_001890 [Jeotgalibacillus campisalis]
MPRERTTSVGAMDATPLKALVLTVVFSAIALYFLYFVVRAGVRDGILQADKKRHEKAEQ